MMYFPRFSSRLLIFKTPQLKVLQASPAAQQWVFAMIWDRMRLAHTTEKAVGRQKRELIQRARLRGRVLDVGSGTGPALKYYASEPEITEIYCVEPNPHFIPGLRKAAQALPADKKAFIFNGTLEEFLLSRPAAAGSFDGVVFLHVLCSVPGLNAAIKMARIALCKGGRLVFLEHVAAPEGSWLRFWQRALRIPWMLFGANCQLCRDPVAAVRALKWASLDVEEFEAEKIKIPFIRPHVCCVATTAEAKGGLHKEADDIVRRAEARLRRGKRGKTRR